MFCNDELQEMLKREYLRRLAKYKLTDQSFQEKYGMNLEEFEQENMRSFMLKVLKILNEKDLL
jgi:hypothetical protein